MAEPEQQGLKQDFISRLSTNRQHLIAILILLVLPVILFDSTIVGGKRLMGHDTVQWRAGAESIIEYRHQTGEEALWATNMFSGMPAYVISYQKAVYHLDNLLTDLFGSIYPAAPFWILLVGVYLFFILQGIRPFAAILGAIFIGFTTYIPIILGAGHNTKFLAYAFIPWMLNGYWILSKTDKRLLGLFLFAVALTLEFRAGHPQVTYYFVYLMVIWWLFDTYQAYKWERFKDWSKVTGLLTLGLLLALVANLQPYWSIFEYTPYTIRGGSALSGDGGLSLEYAFRWSQGLGEMLTLVIPGIYGGSSSEVYWGLKPGTSGPHYFGAIAFLLALIGLVSYRKRRAHVFLGTGVLTALFSLGYHFPLLNRFMFNYVPYFNKFRTPEMWLIVTVFCFSVLAVYGVNELIEQVKKERSKSFKTVWLPLGMAAAFGLLFTFGGNTLLSFENPEQRARIEQQIARQNNLSPDNPQVKQAASQYINTRLKPQRKEMAKEDATRYLILVMLAGALIVLFYHQKLSTGFFLIGLIALASYDMLTVGERYTNEQAMVPGYIDTANYVERQKLPVDDYLVDNIKSEDGYPYRVFTLDRNPFNNAIPAYFYPSIGGYTGAKLSYYQDMIDELLFAGPSGLNLAILNMLNVRYVTASRDLPFQSFTEVYQGDNRQVFENSDVLPKAFFVDSVANAGSAREAIGLMQPDNHFDPSEYAVVESSKRFEMRTDMASSVTVTRYDNRHVYLEVNRSEPGFMVLSEIWYPEGWRAYIDGNQTPIYKTNYILRGVEVPAGEHSIEFRFNPQSYTLGAKVAWAGNIVQWLLGVVLLTGYIRRKWNPPPEDES